MKAGRTKPKHKNGGSDSGAMQDWFALMTVVQVISVSRKAPVAPGMAARITATRANSQPQGAPGKAGAVWETHVKIAFMHLCFSIKKVVV